MKRDQGYEIAVRMFQREHDRWIQNALVLFGSLVSIFLIYETLEDLVPLSAVLALTMVIAFVTVCVELSIRGTSDAWRDTIRTIEESAAEDIRPFGIFQNHLDGQRPSRSTSARPPSHWILSNMDLVIKMLRQVREGEPEATARWWDSLKETVLDDRASTINQTGQTKTSR